MYEYYVRDAALLSRLKGHGSKLIHRLLSSTSTLFQKDSFFSVLAVCCSVQGVCVRRTKGLQQARPHHTRVRAAPCEPEKRSARTKSDSNKHLEYVRTDNRFSRDGASAAGQTTPRSLQYVQFHPISLSK